MNCLQLLLVFICVSGVCSDSGDGLEGLEEGFLFDDVSNETGVDYHEGSGEVGRESFRDILEFPVCVTDDDCEKISAETDENFRCFQYMCYPWSRGEGGGPFRSCKRRSDCRDLNQEEGGDGSDGDCYRHHDRRNVFAGICLHHSEILSCSEHKDCPPHLRCTNFYCGEHHYYQALKSEACPMGQDSFCQDLLLGTSCCFDFSGELLQHPDSTDWNMKCCDQELGAHVVAPRDGIEEVEIRKVGPGIDVDSSDTNKVFVTAGPDSELDVSSEQE